MDLTSKQQERLVKYLEMATYQDGSYTFGPVQRRDAQELYDILNIIRAGHDAAYVDKSTVNDDKAPIFVYVRNNQALKLLKVVSQLTGKSLTDLTGGTYEVKEKITAVISVVKSVEKPAKKRGRPKKEEKKLDGFNLDFDFSDMLKQ